VFLVGVCTDRSFYTVISCHLKAFILGGVGAGSLGAGFNWPYVLLFCICLFYGWVGCTISWGLLYLGENIQ
jgi:hypothetical protein